MPQAILPLFSDDMIIINNHFAVRKKDNVIYWFQGIFPVFRHHVHDHKSFRSFCCQLINLDNATSAEISKALHVNAEKLSRWAREERSMGASDNSSLSADRAKSIKKKRPS